MSNRNKLKWIIRIRNVLVLLALFLTVATVFAGWQMLSGTKNSFPAESDLPAQQSNSAVQFESDSSWEKEPFDTTLNQSGDEPSSSDKSQMQNDEDSSREDPEDEQSDSSQSDSPVHEWKPGVELPSGEEESSESQLFNFTLTDNQDGSESS